MATVEKKGKNQILFPAELATDLLTKVTGKSSIARMVGATPLAFNGNELVYFSMDNEVNLLGESEAKTQGDVSFTQKIINPLKVEYGIRVSDEFLYATEERQIDLLRAFNDGFSKKLARALDIMAMHGLNPRTATASSLIGTNHLDAATAGTNTITTTAGAEDKDINKAIALFDNVDYVDVNGLIISKPFRTALSELEYKSGYAKFPQLALGAQVADINGLALDVNSTVSFADSDTLAYVGDFQNYFKWGVAKEIPMQVIEFGDPDNTGNDLKGHNQVFIRAETYLGWSVLDEKAFARIVKAKG